MTFIADNQLILLIVFFLAGCTGTWRLFAKPAGHRAWKIADLVWVVLGGIGALVAVVTGIYSADTSRLERQIDIAYAATKAFDTDAARFNLRSCDPAYDADNATLCEKIEFFSASTAENADLPLFIAVTDRISPLRKLAFFQDDMDDMKDLEAFDPDAFLVFASLDEPTQAAVDNMRRKVPTIAGDFLILARAYDDLIEQTRRLRDEWSYLQSDAYILVLQVLALCLVSFAAPFRLGKSLVDLRG